MSDDTLFFTPEDVDLSRSPLRRSLDADTYVLGAFNPGLTRLPGGNLLAMVRVAEALCEPVVDGHARTIRWTPDGYVLDRYPLDAIEMDDPRTFRLRGRSPVQAGLTSLSWLLPVELSGDARSVVKVHYDKAVEPSASFMALGVEDARISLIGGAWYMTACGVSDERQCTVLYRSVNGLDYRCEGIVLDHQNKDMCLFEGKVGGRFMALTRPLGEVYFAPPPDSPFAGGPAIHLAQSLDALHWKPLDTPGLRARAGTSTNLRMGGGTPPFLTPQGWLMLYHGVERRDGIGTYRTFWAVLDRDDPSRVVRQEDGAPLLEEMPALTEGIADRRYLPSPVVFTTGIAETGDTYIVASGESDLACRISHLPKSRFA
ncbi:glycosidase [Sphingomonas sp. ST-64]|uniref:Glycosidase n=1 Tax=Sphingomonas plantiphila TaxID=3163295 RepID=A0ABW8YIP7_9SPHN